jgi:ribosomal protein S25
MTFDPFAGLIDQILRDPPAQPLPKPRKGNAIQRPVTVYEELRRPISCHDVAERYKIAASTASDCLKQAGQAGLMRVVLRGKGGRPALWIACEVDR